MQDKEKIRSDMKKLRASLAPSERDKLSTAACANLLSLGNNLFTPHKAVLGYLALPEELSIDPLLYAWKEANRLIGFPVVSKSTLIPCVLPEKHELRLGRFNLREPLPDATTALPLEQIGSIILPGLAFDRSGYRVGYGKGYYDRFISQFPDRPILVGICFDFQLYGRIPADSHDIPVDYLITPSTSFRCKN